MGNSQLAINFERLTAHLQEINAINRQADGSCCRLALTDADRKARDLVVRWMSEAGLATRVDQIGNLIGVQSGSGRSAAVMTGSHIDTVATGGAYDGTFGVLAGIEAIQTLGEASILTKHPLAVAVFTNEEGVRFQPDMMGSLVFAGDMALQAALATVGTDGSVLGQELERIGYAGSMECGQLRPRAFVELHIEQGPVLDRAGEALGAVEDLQGISWQEVVVHGTANHAGTTPMTLRNDAAYCAAKIAVFVRDLAHRMGGAQVATVGSLRLLPDLINVIAREARLTVDLRNTDENLLQSAEDSLARFIHALAATEGVDIQTRQLVRTKPVQFHESVLQVIESVARDQAHPIRRMTSGAGHDAQMLARICPASMIFVPSVAGISHNPREFTSPEH